MCGMPKIFISGDPGILLSPGFFKGIQGALGRRFIYCGINSFEIGHERFQILVGHIFARIAQLVDNAVLDVCLWKHCIDGVRKPSQVVCARDENVVDPSIFEAAEHHRPVLGALVFPDPHAQNVLAVFQINSNGDIHGLFYDLPFAADMVVDGVHENDGIGAFQGSLLPFPDDGQDLVRDSADGGIRYLHAVNVPDMSFDIRRRHSFGIHRQNLFLDVLADAGLVLLEQLRLKLALPIPRGADFHICSLPEGISTPSPLKLTRQPRLMAAPSSASTTTSFSRYASR